VSSGIRKIDLGLHTRWIRMSNRRCIRANGTRRDLYRPCIRPGQPIVESTQPARGKIDLPTERIVYLHEVIEHSRGRRLIDEVDRHSVRERPIGHPEAVLERAVIVVKIKNVGAPEREVLLITM